MKTKIKLIDKIINEELQKFMELGKKENAQQLIQFLDRHSFIKPQVRGIEFKKEKRISGILESRINIDIKPKTNSQYGSEDSNIIIEINITSALNFYIKYIYMIYGGTGYVCSEDGTFQISREEQTETEKEMIENIYNTAIDQSKSNPNLLNKDSLEPIKIFVDYIDYQTSCIFIKHIAKNLNEEQKSIIRRFFFSYYEEEDSHYNKIHSFKNNYNYESAHQFSLSENIKFIKAFKRLEDYCINFVYRNSFGLFKPDCSSEVYLLQNTRYNNYEEFQLESEPLLSNEIVIMNRKLGYEKDRYIYDNEKLIVIAADYVYEFKNGQQICVNGEVGTLSPEFIALIQLLDY